MDSISSSYDGYELAACAYDGNIYTGSRVPVIPEMRGVVNDINVRLRTAPQTDVPILGVLSFADTLTVIDRDDAQMRIGALNAYWYKVRTAEDILGWVYRAYIELQAR